VRALFIDLAISVLKTISFDYRTKYPSCWTFEHNV